MAGAEGAVSRGDTTHCAGRTVDDDQRCGGVSGALHLGQIERRVHHRQGRCHDDRHVVGQTPGHHGRRCELLDRAHPLERAHLAECGLGRVTNGEHHALDPVRRGDDDGEAVGTAEFVELFEGRSLIVGGEQDGHHEPSSAATSSAAIFSATRR